MSLAPSDESIKAEPNLTPLLDVVLQLLMFFIMIINVVGEQVNMTIVLPTSQSALPIKPGEKDVLFLNLTEDGRVLIENQKAKTLDEAEGWLRDKYRFAAKQGAVKTAVIVRAHRNADYALVWQLMRYCNEAGYSEFHVRALNRSSSGG